MFLNWFITLCLTGLACLLAAISYLWLIDDDGPTHWTDKAIVTVVFSIATAGIYVCWDTWPFSLITISINTAAVR